MSDPVFARLDSEVLPPRPTGDSEAGVDRELLEELLLDADPAEARARLETEIARADRERPDCSF